LWRGRHWAEWLAVIPAGIYLPVEVQHFAHHATRLNASVICFNVVIVLYLAKLLIQQRAERHAAETRQCRKEQSSTVGSATQFRCASGLFAKRKTAPMKAQKNRGIPDPVSTGCLHQRQRGRALFTNPLGSLS